MYYYNGAVAYNRNDYKYTYNWNYMKTAKSVSPYQLNTWRNKTKCINTQNSWFYRIYIEHVDPYVLVVRQIYLYNW